MSIIYGAAGALAVLLLLALGAALGWCARGRLYHSKAEKPEAEELRRMQEEQEAFRQLQRYSADVAYGLTRSLEKEGDTA